MTMKGGEEMSRICALIVSIAVGIVAGVVAGLFAGFGFIGSYFAPVIFILALSSVIFLVYALLRYFLCVSRVPIAASAASVTVNTLVLALISGTLAGVPVAIGFIFGIGFGIFATAVASVVLSK